MKRYFFILTGVFLVFAMLFTILYLESTRFNFAFLGKNTRINKTYQNFVIGGVDQGESRTDLLILAQYNFSARSLSLLQIPRDTKVDNSRCDKKINSAYGVGPQTMFKEVKQVTGLDVDKYIIISFNGFRSIIDEIGGIDIEVPTRMYYTDPNQRLVIDLKKGMQHLDGAKSEMFMRFRQNNDGTGYVDGDVGRIKAHVTFYNAAIDKIFSNWNILKVPKIYSILKSNIKTNFNRDELLRYISDARKIDKHSVKIYQIPGEGRYESNISYYFVYKRDAQKMISENFLK